MISISHEFECTGGEDFTLATPEDISPPGPGACGVPDGDTIIMIGGNNFGHVSRWMYCHYRPTFTCPNVC